MNTEYFNFQNNFNNIDLNFCADELKNGNIGIFPTDTVYGIGCNCFDKNAINDLYKVKQRSYKKPINVLISNIEMLNNLVQNINPIEQKLMEIFWPGNLTIIFNKSKIVPDILTSDLNTIGIRMPNNKICLDLINTLGFPIATSSANLADEEPSTYISNKLMTDFDNKISFIIDEGPIKNGLPSTIVRVENNEVKILRQGHITLEKIMEVLKNVK